MGVQDDAFEFRADRLSLTGTLFNNRARPWGYLVAFEYRGLDGNPDNDFSFYDYAIKIPAGPLGPLSIGKMKETFSYELVGDSAFLPHLERIMSPLLHIPLSGRAPQQGPAWEPRDPSFSGWYVTGSWVVTGETRGYDQRVGYARKVVPTRTWGAIELVGRYSAVDGSSRSIDGGYMGKWLAAVNYYPTTRMRISVGTGQTTLDRNGITGKTFQTLARVQWIY